MTNKQGTEKCCEKCGRKSNIVELNTHCPFCDEKLSTVLLGHPSGVKAGDKMCSKCNRIYQVPPQGDTPEACVRCGVHHNKLEPCKNGTKITIDDSAEKIISKS